MFGYSVSLIMYQYKSSFTHYMYILLSELYVIVRKKKKRID